MTYFRWQYLWNTDDEDRHVFSLQEKLQGCWWVDTDSREYLLVGLVSIKYEVAL